MAEINTLQSWAEVRNTAPIAITMTTADTYYIIKDSTFLNYLTPIDFTFSATTGKLTYTGTEDKKIAFWGDSIFKLNSTDEVTYSLFINDTETPHMQSIFDVGFSNKSNLVGINGVGIVSNGDTLSIRVKCDGTGKIITVVNLHLLLISIFTN